MQSDRPKTQSSIQCPGQILTGSPRGDDIRWQPARRHGLGRLPLARLLFLAALPVMDLPAMARPAPALPATATPVATTKAPIAGGLGKRVSYVNLTAKADQKAFYAAAGANHAGKRIHIHVPAKRIHAKPERSFTTRAGVRYLVFKNDKVPIVARSNDVYLRKARQRTRPNDTLCVKGVVKTDGSSGSSGYVIKVVRVTKAP